MVELYSLSFPWRALSHAVDNMKPEDVGLSSELQFFKTKDAVKETPRVTYTTIYKCDDFSVRVVAAACLIFIIFRSYVLEVHIEPFKDHMTWQSTLL